MPVGGARPRPRTGIGEFRDAGADASADGRAAWETLVREQAALRRGVERLPFHRAEGPPGEGTVAAMYDAVAVLVRALGARDRYTYAHSERVAALAVEVARRLGASSLELADLYVGAVLHDVGKIAVPDAALLKPGPLAPWERKEVERHPVCGEGIVAPLAPTFPGMAAVVRSHHERWDGAGYPDGLAGEAIPPLARVAAAADAFDAMTSERPYRRALSRKEAADEIARGVGAQFDPLVASALLRAIRSA